MGSGPPRPYAADVEVGVLGPVRVALDAREVDLGTPKQRALVAALALSRGRAVPVDTLVDLLWGDHFPPAVTATLQAYVSGLRRVLEPGRERRSPATVLVTVAPGYALKVADDLVDATRFERLAGAEHRRLQPVSSLGGRGLSAAELTAAVEALDEALSLWRGTPYGELEDAPAAVAERVRLEELRLVALEDRAVAGLCLGHHATVAAELEALTGAHPLRERLWALRAVALTRSGRQAAALEVLGRVREVLDEELGLEPSAELRDLQTAVLRQDPALEWVAPDPGGPTPAPPAVAPAPLAGSSTESAAAEPRAVAPWPMVGRDRDLAALREALEVACSGATTYVVLTGEPGIGKSRLAAELGELARAGGVRVLVGRCSQDDGAPPLWPWATVLGALGRQLPTSTGADDDEGDRFRSWAEIAEAVVDAARERPTMLVLDDLHWADTATLRVLRLLADAADGAGGAGGAGGVPLLVVVTWRPHPEPTGALADVAETLARRHAVRRELTGLPADDVVAIFETVASRAPSPAQADELRARTDGNPFFLVEYARLAGERVDLADLLGEAHPPTAVSEVILRRLDRLPDPTVAALRAAAVIGRRFDAPTLAAAGGIDEDDLLDVVEPAQAAGLVREDGVDRFVFAHALVRDTLAAGLTASRRARLHARVALALADVGGRETEESRHLLAAGPSYAGRAWRAAVVAAELARRLHAHEESAELLRSALDVMADDPAATARDRYDVLLHLVDSYRWSAMWPELTGAVEEAVAVAEGLDDPELVARAAIATTQGALWQSAPHGQVHASIVTALRGCLDRLPAADGALRCRVMLGLANELYYGSTYQERRALVDEALAMARRLDDDELLLDACQIGFVSLWCPRTASERLALAEEAVALAQAVGNERAHVVAATLRTVVLGELGRPAEMWTAAKVARAEATRLRMPYGLLVLDSLELPWHAMAGRFEECAEVLERIRHLDAQITLEQSEDATAGAMISLSLWQGGSAEAARMLAEMEPGPFPITATVVIFLWRGGEEEAALEHHRAHTIELDTDDWFSMLAWCNAGEAALHVGDAELGSRAYERLAPYAGHGCSAGSGNACGPVDAFLALAAAAAGEREVAAGHADDAERLCAEWDVPLVTRWLRDQRERYTF